MLPYRTSKGIPRNQDILLNLLTKCKANPILTEASRPEFKIATNKCMSLDPNESSALLRSVIIPAI